MSLDDVLETIDHDIEDAVARLFQLLRIPSISTDPTFKADCKRAADWLVDDLRSFGIANARTVSTAGHPMVLGHVDGPSPHLLFYGHYDVQPVDPVELWTQDPFNPCIESTISGKVIRARGASDDKGQLMTFVEACRAWMKVYGTLPCKVTFFLEGEEESGSPSLLPFLAEHKDDLTSDLALICDTGLFNSRVPAITTMLRGLLGEEIIIYGPNKDLHSGAYGGPAINPIRVLSRILAALHDTNGRITIPGFYDNVPDIPEQRRTEWDTLEFDAPQFLREVGLSHPAGEHDRTPLEMLWSRPTCEINGISGGYEGDGFKTVLPSKASAKLSFRLVGNQDPVIIRKQLRTMIQNMLPPDCTVKFIEHGNGMASNFDTAHPAFDAARRALSDEWNETAVSIGCGGSIPIAGYLQHRIGSLPMLIGFGKDDDQIHSPNEKYDLRCFRKGMRSWARILDALTSPEDRDPNCATHRESV